jgi:hypothetical protein
LCLKFFADHVIRTTGCIKIYSKKIEFIEREAATPGGREQAIIEPNCGFRAQKYGIGEDDE